MVCDIDEDATLVGAVCVSEVELYTAEAVDLDME